MEEKLTRRNVLLECLEMMRMRMKVVSVNREGRVPIPGYEDELVLRQKKCRVIQDMIQALESEPVRAAMANWQIMLMKGERPTTNDLIPKG